jgi:hypothetical protein
MGTQRLEIAAAGSSESLLKSALALAVVAAAAALGLGVAGNLPVALVAGI